MDVKTEQQIAKLQKEVAVLQKQVAALLILSGVNAVPEKSQEAPETVKEAMEILKTIPKETLQKLGVCNVGFDAKSVWMSLATPDGTISIKKQEFDFRIRRRDAHGVIVSEAAVPVNGLHNALATLAL